ncbi:MarR family transcriptional regulator [Streptacidiphilus pinicola]|uniref:MarR family transcriptional regulator n=1 Tax=Streptacidiphilus pinicola TaxID=2219663 RepID=A0A2X0J1H1_9ACTN|nr:MarR family transcriptional regulator [Streptacidiphilus pinicola]RAG81198.1 MarR family transcriptional regulator [Streptacidiphilus pinicola]
MSTTPTVNGQVIGRAHYATRALLGPVLDRTATTFDESLVLNSLAGDAEGVDRAELLGLLAGNLKISEAEVAGIVDELAASALLEAGDDSRLRLTDAGRARNHEIRSTIAAITQRIYADIPAEDLATTGRVLTLLTARADAELAALR